jgi:hypothetical protein
MKLIRTRMVVSLASSALLASGFGLTALAVSSTAQGTIVASQSAHVSPNTTVIDYGTHK